MTSSSPDLNHLTPDQLRKLATDLMRQVETLDQTIQRQKIVNEKQAHELAILKRHRFGKRSEALGPEQGSLLDDLIDADLAAIETEMIDNDADCVPARKRAKAKRQALPPELPRTIIEHEPKNTLCECGCQRQRIGEDVSEKLDYAPGTFTVERHVRGKWACKQCDTLIQAPVPAQVIDKGIPTAKLLAHVLVAKYADHLPLYRQESIFARAGHGIPRSTLAEWVGQTGIALQPLADELQTLLLEQPILHADETPVPMLAPGKKKTHKAYIWAYASTQQSAIKGVVYDFSETRAGQSARDFLGDWQGHLVCDDYAGYKESFNQGVTEVACWAHARRKFYDLIQSKTSHIADEALELIQKLYTVEAEAKSLTDQERKVVRQKRSQPILKELHAWLLERQRQVPKGSPISKAIHYSLKRWPALILYADSGSIPIDNNWVENQVRPWALGRKNWLFAGSLRSGRRAAAVMTLIQSAKINGLDPYEYLADVLNRLPTQQASAIRELLPHEWKPADKMG